MLKIWFITAHNTGDNFMLHQPIITREPEPGHIDTMLTLSSFIELLRPEEAYFPKDLNDPKVQITQIRKIFYDKWGWNTQVIRGAKNIDTRYEMKLIKKSNSLYSEAPEHLKKRLKKYQPDEQIFVSVYKSTDKVYPDRAGQIPEIYAHDDQELLLPEGYICDIGHVLTGVDSFNYLEPISPMPNWLLWARKLLPYCSSNMDFATWLGDMASAAGEFLFLQLNNKSIDRSSEQTEINRFNPGSDMLGNIDAYAIAKAFNTNTIKGKPFSEMLTDFYSDDKNAASDIRKNRFIIFCEGIGLKGWNGENFDNENEWLKKYIRELRAATIFYIFGRMENGKGIILATKVWFRFYEKKLALNQLLIALLEALKTELRKA